MSSEQDAVEQLDRAQGQMMNALADAQEQGRTGWVTHAKLRRWMDTVGEAKQAIEASQQENERLREFLSEDLWQAIDDEIPSDQKDAKLHGMIEAAFEEQEAKGE